MSTVIPTRASNHQGYQPALHSKQQLKWEGPCGNSRKSPLLGLLGTCSGNKHKDQEVLLSFRHIHCLDKRRESCLETSSARFMLYLVTGQGWPQTLYSSQGTASRMWLVGKGTITQFKFLVKQHRLKGESPEKQSPWRHCWVGKGKAWDSQPKDVPQLCLRKLSALLLSSWNRAVRQIRCLQTGRD